MMISMDVTDEDTLEVLENLPHTMAAKVSDDLPPSAFPSVQKDVPPARNLEKRGGNCPPQEMITIWGENEYRNARTISVFARYGTASAQWYHDHVVSSRWAIVIEAVVCFFNSGFRFRKFIQGCGGKGQR
jgi:hypothetical protein